MFKGHIKLLLPPLLLFSILLISLNFYPSYSQLTTSTKEKMDYQGIIEQIDLAKIKMNLQEFTKLSRVSGYSGCEAAAEFIYQKFNEYRLVNVSSEYYNLTVPIEYSASITIIPSGETIRAYTLWPNLVETCALPPEGIEGKLVYVKKGELKDYNERVEGKIVLMDFYSRDNWLYAVQFGAKAVVYIEEETTRWDAQLKVLSIPLDFPRLYVTKENGEYLISLLEKGDVYVNVKSFMIYETSKARNIIGYVPGTDPQLKDEIIIISAYYDSYSVVPSLAPGAEEACGIATLLEYARFFSRPENRPKRTIMFVALSGHNFALVGAREFVYNHFNEIGSKLKIWIHLDLNTLTDRVGVFYWSRFYSHLLVSGRYGFLRQKIFGEYKPMIEDALRKELGREYYVEDFMLNNIVSIFQRGIYENEPLYFDSEPFSLAGGVGISFYTVGIVKLYYGTPFDTFEKLKLENLEPQAKLIACIIFALLNDDQIELPDLKPKVADPREGGFAVMRGRVVEYNRERAWYTGVPRALVVVHMPSNEDIGLLGQTIIVQADENGYFYIRGMAHAYTYAPSQARLFVSYDFEAYSDEPTYGPIDYAPDYGRYSVFQYKYVPVDLPEKFVNIVVFKCGVLSIMGLINPRGTPLPVLNVDIRIFRTDQIPDFYGYVVETRRENLMIFGELGKRIEVILRTTEVEPFAVALNASKEMMEGYGFIMRSGEATTINTFQLAQDMFYIDEARLQEIEKWRILPEDAIVWHNIARDNLQRAIDAIYSSPPDYQSFLSNAIQALSIESGAAYVKIKAVMKDIVDATIFFYLLLIPFSLLMERFLISSTKLLRRSICVALIFLLFSTLFYFLHPGFKVTLNPYMAITAFALTLFTAPAVLLLTMKLFESLKEIRKEVLGAHFLEASKGSIFFAASSLGIQNMRRRRFRTTLILVSLVLIIFSMTAFSSITNIYIRKPLIFNGTTRYQGIYTRIMAPQLPALPKYVIEVIYEKMRSYTSVVARRMELRAGNPFVLTGPNGRVFLAKAIIGLEESESEVTGIKEAIINGSWWFSGISPYSCIIPEKVARDLSVNVGDCISLYGVNLRVIGIFDSNIYASIVDLDQGTITPMSRVAMGSRLRFSPSEIIVVPYTFVLRLSVDEAYSISIEISDKGHIADIADQLGVIFPGVLVYASVKDGEITSFYSEEQIVYSGWQTVIVPFVLGILIMFNMLLGSIQEREIEIGILSSLGLSPRHILGIFIIEPILYAFVGAVLGYIIGVAGNIFLETSNMLPPKYIPNVASRWTIMSMGSCMISMIISSLYPAYKASKLVTPSLERAWRIPTRPKGDEWIIPLPFIIRMEELGGIIEYMKEYFQAHSTERAGIFWVRDLQYQEGTKEEILVKILSMIARLAPYEAGLEQETKLVFFTDKERKQANIELHLRRVSGVYHVWKSSNRSYIDNIRKQLLLWSSLRESDKKKYLRQL